MREDTLVQTQGTSEIVSPCRIVLVGGTSVTRQALAALLASRESGVVVAAEACGAGDLVDQALSSSPDLVLVDMRPPDAELILACREVRERMPSAAIVLHSTHVDARGVIAIAFSGAVGYVPKILDRDELIRRLLMIHSEHDRLSAKVGEGLLAWFDRWSAGCEPGRISPHDRSLLQMLIRGASDSEMAAQFGFDRVTLRSEIARLCLALSDEPAFRTTGSRLARLLA